MPRIPSPIGFPPKSLEVTHLRALRLNLDLLAALGAELIMIAEGVTLDARLNKNAVLLTGKECSVVRFRVSVRCCSLISSPVAHSQFQLSLLLVIKEI